MAYVRWEDDMLGGLIVLGMGATVLYGVWSVLRFVVLRVRGRG